MSGLTMGIRAINPTTTFLEKHLKVSCPACGAKIGQRCRGQQHSEVLVRTHAVRAVKAKEQNIFKKVLDK